MANPDPKIERNRTYHNIRDVVALSILENNHSQSALTMSTNNAVIARLKILISPNDYKIGT